MDGEMPKAIWGFNGTERPGAVYLASALAGHTPHNDLFNGASSNGLSIPQSCTEDIFPY